MAFILIVCIMKLKAVKGEYAVEVVLLLAFSRNTQSWHIGIFV